MASPMKTIADRPRVFQGIRSPTGGVVPSVVFGLTISRREFSEWRSGGSTIEGTYQIEVTNNGPIPSPVLPTSVTVNSNEDELTIISKDSLDKEAKTASPGDSVVFDISFSVDASSASTTVRNGCGGTISCNTEEVVAARLLGATYTSDGDVNVSSPNCNISGGGPVEQPGGPPAQPPEEPPEEEPPEEDPEPIPAPIPAPKPPDDGGGGDDGDDGDDDDGGDGGGGGGRPACGEGEGEIDGPTIVLVDETNEWEFTGNVEACNDREHRLIWDMKTADQEEKDYGGRFGIASVKHAYEFAGPKTMEFRIESQATDEVLYSTKLDVTVEDPTTGGLGATRTPSMSDAADF